MEKFILKSKQVILDDSQINLILYPDHSYLFDKIEVAEIISSKINVDSQIADMIVLYTPILFEKIQGMENIPQYVKDNIEL
jgi:hypothetical protein